MYSDLDEARMRLNGTIIRYAGKPVRIYSINRTELDLTVTFHPLGRTRRVTKSMNDPLFDKDPIPLGYSNLDHKALYLMRGPGRRYKQGLSHENALAIRADYTHAVSGDMVPLGENLIHTVMNEYPSMEESIKWVWDKDLNGDVYSSRAFARKLAIHKDFSSFLFLEYKGKKVGIFNRKKDTVELSPNYDYLFEFLKSNGVHTNVG